MDENGSKEDYTIANISNIKSLDSGPRWWIATLIGEKNDGAHTIRSLISHVGVIWSRLKKCVCVCDIVPGQRSWLDACKDPAS